MKTSFLRISLSLPLLAAGLLGGCLKNQTRGNADAQPGQRAHADAPGASTAGAAGESKNFGDVDAKQQAEKNSPSGASPTPGPGSTGGPGAHDRNTTTTIQPAPKK